MAELTKPTVVSIELQVLKEVIKSLEFSREEVMEALIVHDRDVGRTTRKNSYIAEMYETEVVKLDNLIHLLSKTLINVTF